MTKRTLLASAVLMVLAAPAAADYARGTMAYQSGLYATAYQEFRASASTGNAPSQFMMGRLYSEGRGIDRDFIHAYAWYSLSAANGYGPAATARDTLASTLTPSQLQSAEVLAAQWSGSSAAPAPTSPTPVTYAPYSVAGVQRALNALGYAAGPADGLMGPKTRAAISAYQTDSGLPVSAQPSVTLYEQLQQTLAARTQPTNPTPAPATNATLIAEVQTELRLRDYPVPAVNGQLDAATVAAIRSYQADASLEVDGKVTDALLAQLRSGRLDEGAAYRDQVKALQTALNQRGFDAGPADGALGPKTRTAIRGYQQSAGLPVTGEMSRGLLEQMGLLAATPGTTPGGGDSGQTAASLQQAIEVELLRLNYAAGSADGVLDEQARKAIRQYQTATGLKQTGEPSRKLLDSLRASNARNNGETLSLLVWNVESELQRRGYPPGPIDGTLDEKTRLAILDYQRDSGLAITGQVNEPLLAALRDPAQGNTTTLSAGEVWELENQLARLGYEVGTIDGVADQRTFAAARAFQADQGLQPTGRLDQNLLDRVQTASVGEPRGNQAAADQIREQLIRGVIQFLDQQ